MYGSSPSLRAILSQLGREKVRRSIMARVARIRVRFRQDYTQVIYQSTSPRGTYYTIGGAKIPAGVLGKNVDKVALLKELSTRMGDR